jgi:hypothetical protein
MEKSTQYKGLFYNHKTSHKFYEGGAHFSYHSLVKILNEIKDKLNKNREDDLNITLSNKEKELDKKEEKIEIKKVNIPLLSKQKNNSMTSILNDNKIFTKIINNKLQKTNNDKMRIILKERKLANIISSNSVKNLNDSIYNNRNNINMPIIYNNQKNKSENKIIKKNTSIGALNNKYKLIKMSSTIGFNENNKCYNYYLLNNINSRNKIMINPTNSISHSLNKYNAKNNSYLSDKFKLINNYNKNLKLYNNNKNVDYININNHYIKINKNQLNNTKMNFNNERGIKGKYIINDDKNRERMKMNMSVFNFSMLKKYN